MQNITRNSYSLFQRKTGTKTVWYARFWDDELQTYTGKRSTGQTTKTAAHRQVQQWLIEGLPERERKAPGVSQQRILTAIRKHLIEAGTIEKDGEHDDAELIKLFYTKVTSEKMAGGETFAAYLSRFWDWNGDYVKGRQERKKSIGLKHVTTCLTLIRLHIAPYFKDALLHDITARSLEDFMRSIPRRDDDPKNGYSRRTINGIMKVIKIALKQAVRLDILPKNPADKIELLADDTRERGILTPAELERLFRLQWSDERGKIAAVLAASSGMRLGEIISLQIENLDFERNIIHVLHSYSVQEKRIKGTKSGKPRMIFTDPIILRMLAYLHAKNPHKTSFIFYGLEPDKPVREDAMERYTEKALAEIFGEDVKASFTKERNTLAKALVLQLNIPVDEYIAFTKDNLDTIQNTISLTRRYTINGVRLKTLRESEKRIISIDPALMKRLAAFCGQAPYVFIAGGTERESPVDFESMEEKERKRLMGFLGEMTRRERNISFHGFRHFFNSTIRGSVPDDILRLQTGHADAKMTDHYDHLTDDRGEQLRKAVQVKILPYIPSLEEGESLSGKR